MITYLTNYNNHTSIRRHQCIEGGLNFMSAPGINLCYYLFCWTFSNFCQSHMSIVHCNTERLCASSETAFVLLVKIMLLPKVFWSITVYFLLLHCARWSRVLDQSLCFSTLGLLLVQVLSVQLSCDQRMSRCCLSAVSKHSAHFDLWALRSARSFLPHESRWVNIFSFRDYSLSWQLCVKVLDDHRILKHSDQPVWHHKHAQDPQVLFLVLI